MFWLEHIAGAGERQGDLDAEEIMRRGLVRPPKALPSMSERLIMPTWEPGMPGISNCGIIEPVSVTWCAKPNARTCRRRRI